ncbi:MAG: LruC domain-containing protein [Prevotellaceae bacterium]|nr:LruC domain-containing protein [Prevotellaceae bacterium]
MRKLALFLTIALVIGFTGCQKENLFEEPYDKTVSGEDMGKIYSDITVGANLPAGTRVQVYDAYPYNEQGQNIGIPVLNVKAPFDSQKIKLTLGLSKVYTVINGAVRAWDVDNMSITAANYKEGAITTRVNRAPGIVESNGQVTKLADVSISTELESMINAGYPEKTINVWDPVNGLSSDLVIVPPHVGKITTKADGSIQIDEIKGTQTIDLTYIGDGGSNLTSDLYYYTYTIDASGKYTPAEYEKLELVPVFSKMTATDQGKTAQIGPFTSTPDKLTRVGFAYQGRDTQNSYSLKYSTPYYNSDKFKGANNGKSGRAIGQYDEFGTGGNKGNYTTVYAWRTPANANGGDANVDWYHNLAVAGLHGIPQYTGALGNYELLRGEDGKPDKNKNYTLSDRTQTQKTVEATGGTWVYGGGTVAEESAVLTQSEYDALDAKDKSAYYQPTAGSDWYIYNYYTEGSYFKPTYKEVELKYTDCYVTCGIIRKWNYNNQVYATLGMDAALPVEKWGDNDFNDMLVLLSTDPLIVENEIPVPDDPETKYWSGLWMFEDTYNKTPDYDLNDVVISYAYNETVGDAETGKATLTYYIAALGADNQNTVGLQYNGQFAQLYSVQPKTYMNVGKELNDVLTTQYVIQLPYAGNTTGDTYMPYMIVNGDLDMIIDFSVVVEDPALAPIFESADGKRQITGAPYAVEFVRLSTDTGTGQRPFLWANEGLNLLQAYGDPFMKWIDANCPRRFSEDTSGTAEWYLKNKPADGFEYGGTYGYSNEEPEVQEVVWKDLP